MPLIARYASALGVIALILLLAPPAESWPFGGLSPQGGTVVGVDATTGGGIAVTGTAARPAVGLLTSCAANQVLQWSGSAWVCTSPVIDTVSVDSSIAGLTNNYSVPAGTQTLVLRPASSGVQLTGIVAGTSWQRLHVLNDSANCLQVFDDNSNSTITNRIKLEVGAGASGFLCFNAEMDCIYDPNLGSGTPGRWACSIKWAHDSPGDVTINGAFSTTGTSTLQAVNATNVGASGFVDATNGVYGGVTGTADLAYLHATDSTHPYLGFFYNTNGTAKGYINRVGYQEGTTQFRDLEIDDGKGNAVCTITGSTKTTAFSGPETVTTTSGDPLTLTPSGSGTTNGRPLVMQNSAVNTSFGYYYDASNNIFWRSVSGGVDFLKWAPGDSEAKTTALGGVIVNSTAAGIASGNGSLNVIADTTNNRAISWRDKTSVGEFGFVWSNTTNTQLRDFVNAANYVEWVAGDAAHSTNVLGHLKSTSTAPTLTSCGTSPTITGTDVAGIVTTGTSGTTCTITFAVTYGSEPPCVLLPMGTTTMPVYTVSATAITATTTIASTKYHYVCVGL